MYENIEGAVKFVSDIPVYTKKYEPVEFPRKTRTLDVALQGVLPQNMYDHYVISRGHQDTYSNHCKTYASYAESLLKKFASDCIRIYGRKFITYNVHNLTHLPGDVIEIGCLDSAFPFENKLQSVKMY
jgi:hypothetical protein